MLWVLIFIDYLLYLVLYYKLSMNNDQAIFQNPAAVSQPEQQNVAPPEQISYSQIPSNDSSSNGSTNLVSLSKKLLKILLALFVIIIIFWLVFFIIIPRFSQTNKKITLTYWGLWEDANTMQSVISDFEQQNPTIKIDYIKQDINEYRDRLVTRIGNGTGPDIFRLHNTWVNSLNNYLLPIPSDTISKEEFSSSFYKVAQDDLIKNGAIYAIPLEVDTLAMFINTQDFQNAGIKPPTNWNDFVDDVRALTVKDQNGKIKTSGAAIGTYNNINHAPDIISLLFLQNSVDIGNLQGSADRLNGALNFYTSFATDQNNVWDNNLDPSLLAFSKGDLAIYFGYSWDYFAIKQANPNLAFQIEPVPQLPNQNITLASYWAEGVSVKSKHQKEALAFIKYLSQRETEQKLYAEESKTRAFGEPYARVDLADSLKDNPIVYPFILQAKYASSSYFVDGTFDNALNQQANTYLENDVNSILNGSSPESAFGAFSKGVSQVLQKYGQ